MKRKLGTKKLIAILLVLVFAMASIAGCGGKKEEGGEKKETKKEEGSKSDSGGKKKLGVICIDLNLPFYVEMMESGKEAAEDYGVETIWKSAESNIDNEIGLIDSFIEQKVDCILVDPIDVVALEPAIQRAKDAGIPTITMGNKVKGDNNVNTIYPDHDNYFAIATLAFEMIGGKGDMALMVGAPGNYVSDQRQSGFEDAAKDYKDVKYQILVSNYDAPTGLQKAQEVVASTPDLKAFACVTDDVTVSAMQALKDDTLIFSHDGSKAAIEYVKEGKYECTVLTGSKRVGYWNIVVGAALANGDKVPTDVFLPTYWIVSEKAQKVIDEKGIGKGMNIVSADEGMKKAEGYREEFAPGNYEIPKE